MTEKKNIGNGVIPPSDLLTPSSYDESYEINPFRTPQPRRKRRHSTDASTTEELKKTRPKNSTYLREIPPGPLFPVRTASIDNTNHSAFQSMASSYTSMDGLKDVGNRSILSPSSSSSLNRKKVNAPFVYNPPKAVDIFKQFHARLAWEKEQGDSEIRKIIKQINKRIQINKNQSYVEILETLKKLAKQIISSSIEQLNTDYLSILDNLEKLNRRERQLVRKGIKRRSRNFVKANTSKKESYPQITRKLMFTFSRISRILKFCNTYQPGRTKRSVTMAPGDFKKNIDIARQSSPAGEKKSRNRRRKPRIDHEIDGEGQEVEEEEEVVTTTTPQKMNTSEELGVDDEESPMNVTPLERMKLTGLKISTAKPKKTLAGKVRERKSSFGGVPTPVSALNLTVTNPNFAFMATPISPGSPTEDGIFSKKYTLKFPKIGEESSSSDSSRDNNDMVNNNNNNNNNNNEPFPEREYLSNQEKIRNRYSSGNSSSSSSKKKRRSEEIIHQRLKTPLKSLKEKKNYSEGEEEEEDVKEEEEGTNKKEVVLSSIPPKISERITTHHDDNSDISDLSSPSSPPSEDGGGSGFDDSSPTNSSPGGGSGSGSSGLGLFKRVVSKIFTKRGKRSSRHASPIYSKRKYEDTKKKRKQGGGSSRVQNSTRKGNNSTSKITTTTTPTKSSTSTNRNKKSSDSVNKKNRKNNRKGQQHRQQQQQQQEEEDDDNKRKGMNTDNNNSRNGVTRRTKGGRRNREPNVKRRPPRTSKPILCRICEELIPSHEISKHSKTCRIRKSLTIRSNSYDERLRKVESSIGKRIQMGREGKMRELTKKELEILPKLVRISKRSARLPYSKKGKEKLNDYIYELRRIRKLIPKVRVVSKSSKKQRIGQTIPIYVKRIGMYLQKKLEICTKSLDLNIKPKKFHKVTINDFEILGLITRGAYGRVFLAKKKTTEDLFAIKVLEKYEINRKNKRKDVFKERNIMVQAQMMNSTSGGPNGDFQRLNPFVVKVYYSFEGKRFWYIVMEYCPGGDLFSLLERDQFLEVQKTKKIIAEIILALEYVHKRGIVHRDIKPDNMLIDKKGHVKLTDFGLSEMGLIDMDLFMNNRLKQEKLVRQQSILSQLKRTDSILYEGMLSQPEIPCTPKNERSTTMFSPSESYYEIQKHLPHGDLSPNQLEFPSSPKSRSPHGRDSEKSSSADVSPQSEDGEGGQKTPTRNSSRSNSGGGGVEGGNKIVQGTPDYLGPEILLGKDHGFGVDYWAVGCMLFQFLIGYPPFSADTPKEIFANILSGEINWPVNLDLYELPNEAIDLINKLLVHESEERIGYNGVKEIKRHPFFSDIDWENILREDHQELVPQLQKEDDTSKFRERQGYYPVDQKEGVEELEMIQKDAEEMQQKSESLDDYTPTSPSKQQNNNNNTTGGNNRSRNSSLRKRQNSSGDLTRYSFIDDVRDSGTLRSSPDAILGFSYQNISALLELTHEEAEENFDDEMNLSGAHQFGDDDDDDPSSNTDSYSAFVGEDDYTRNTPQNIEDVQ